MGPLYNGQAPSHILQLRNLELWREPMNGYQRGTDGPSLGTDAGKDAMGLLWLVIVAIVFLTVLDWALPQHNNDAQAQPAQTQNR